MLNKVMLQGRIVADPELKTTNSGVSVVSFTLAVDRDYQTNGERQTDFINIVAWRGTAEFISRYFTKGKMMIVCGTLQVRKYTAQDGTNRYVTEVVAESVNFGGDKPSNAAPAESNSDSELTPLPSEDLPF